MDLTRRRLLLAGSSLLATSCTSRTAPGNASPEFPKESEDREMSPSFPGIQSVHYAEHDPGRDWHKDSRIALDRDTPLDATKILTPNVIRLPGSGYRMYYTGLGPGRPVAEAVGYILSAQSEDAVAWTKEPGIRLDVHSPHATRRVLCPDVIPLAEGGYRMYYEARTAEGPTTVLSAVSTDGLDWQPEPGIRFGDGEWSYGSPRGLYSEGGKGGRLRYRLYCHHYSHPLEPGLGSQNHIVSAISEDGLDFRPEPGIRIPQESRLEDYAVYAPEVIRLGKGSYRMYYAAWTHEPMHGRLFTAVSSDGLDWTKDPEPCLDIGGPWDQTHASEPCVIDLDDGRYRLFYEACDAEGQWRILSATSAPSPVPPSTF